VPSYAGLFGAAFDPPAAVSMAKRGVTLDGAHWPGGSLSSHWIFSSRMFALWGHERLERSRNSQGRVVSIGQSAAADHDVLSGTPGGPHGISGFVEPGIFSRQAMSLP